MANVKSCERNLQIPKIPKKIPNLKKVIPLELIQRPPLPICFGYKSKKDECGICKRCFYNQYIVEGVLLLICSYSLLEYFIVKYSQ